MQGSCPDIKNSLAIDYRNGHIQIGSCCASGRIKVDESPIDTYLKNPKLIEIKNDNTNNIIRDNYCSFCVRSESINQKSRRLGLIDSVKNGFFKESESLTRMDIDLGNLCNLKCAICEPRFSTSWIPDYLAMNKNVPDKFYFKKSNSLSINDPEQLSELEYVKIQGGEPLMDNQHLHLLETFNDLGILPNLVIDYNTNGTQQVNDRVLELWGKAKLVQLFFSIDDIEERFEYQRFGADWQTLLKNLEWFKYNLEPNHMFRITTAISYLNICNLKNLIDWKKNNFDTSRFGDDIWMSYHPVTGNLSIDCLTSIQKQKLENCLPDDLTSYARLPKLDNNYTHSRAFGFLDKLDKIRNTNWRKTLPELVDIFEQHIYNNSVIL